MIDESLIREGETIDAVFEGQFKILQKANGYRFSIDAILLSSFVRSTENDRLLDLGTGSGILAVILAGTGKCMNATGIEVQDELVDMARRNVLVNDLKGRVEIVQGDVKGITSLINPDAFDVTVFNPPYRKIKSGRINPDQQKAIARHEIKATIADFIGAASYALKKSGRVSIIYPAVRMVELIAQMRAAQLEPKRLQIVHSDKMSEGEFVLIEGVQGGGEELEIMPPVYIYESKGVYTKSVAAMLSGRSIFP
jgi:tRNA1Val (adenine37-N6)-methyltransferase